MSGCNAIISLNTLKTAGLKADPQLTLHGPEAGSPYHGSSEEFRRAAHRPATFAAVDFFWIADSLNFEDPTIAFRTQTLM